jgi:small-conductance mechanosensitive channel
MDEDGKASISVEEILDTLQLENSTDAMHHQSHSNDYNNLPITSRSKYGALMDSVEYKPPMAVAAVPTPQSAKEDLRRAVQAHKEHESRLKQAMLGAQECMAVDADELRRDQRRVENFHTSLDVLQKKIEEAGFTVQEVCFAQLQEDDPRMGGQWRKTPR